MFENIDPDLAQEIYNPSTLNQTVRNLLEDSFSLIWLEGEVSNLSRPASGHLYFSLKDARAQVRCALFRNRSRLLRDLVANGQQVLVRARISLYEPRGDFQLIIEHLEDAGAGALRRAFEALRQHLDEEGLFALASKRLLPRFPHRIGVITSPSGAAIRDVLSVLARRFPGPVLIYPTAVQGEGAADQIAGAIALADARRDCDVLLLVRGGGSLEDLWAFNEEVVARAIQACNIPLVCGVGHETDVTIADFVADLRAPTPSAAAELVSPDRLEWLRKFNLLHERLVAALRRTLTARRQTLDWLQQNLARQHPGRRLQDHAQTLDDLEQRLQNAMRIHRERMQVRSAALTARLRVQAPAPRLRLLTIRCDELLQRLQNAMRQRLHQDARRLGAAARALHAVSPLQTLGRGYALVLREDATLVRRARDVQKGEQVEVRLGEGRLLCRVTAVRS